MKNFLIPIALLAMFVSSCSTNQFAVREGTYETDEVYYQPGEKFISDYALVDDEAETTTAAGTDQTQTEDEYYSGDNTTTTTNNGGVVNNYYGNVYNTPGQMFGGRFYGSTFNWPTYYSGWNPYTGWNFGINYGMHWGWGSYWNDPWAWNNPWYDPWGYNNWCWNSWRNPYGFYNPYFGWGYGYGYGYGNYWYNGFGSPGFGWNNGWNNGWDGNSSGFVTGNRTSVSVGSTINSSYNEGMVYNNRVKPQLNSDQINKTPGAVVDNSRDKQNISREQPAVTPAVGPVVSTEEGRTKSPQNNVVATDINKPVLTQNTTTTGSTASATPKVPAGKPSLGSIPQTSLMNSGNAGERTNNSAITGSGDRQVRPTNITRQPTFNVEQNRPSRTGTNPNNQTVRPISPENRGSQMPSRTLEPTRRPSDGVKAPSVQPSTQPERRQPTFTPSGGDGGRRDNSFSTPSSPGSGRTGGGSIGGGGSSPSRSGGGGGGGSSSGARRK